MAALKEAWIQEVMETLKLPAMSPAMCKTILPAIEMHIKKIAQQAHKFQRRGKSARLSVNDINLALAMNKTEPVYGLGVSETVVGLKSTSSTSKHSDGTNIVNLVEMTKSTLLSCPLKPEISLHWLAVNGHQPLIAENPSIISAEAEEQPHSLPKEMQHLYARITGILLATSDSSGSSPALKTVYKVFESDAGLQELTPYLSRFFYQQMRTNTKRLPLLYAIIRSIKALLANPSVSLEAHLQQLLPVIFTCVVSPKLSTFVTDDHWSLRCTAADIIAQICAKYKDEFLDLQPRVYKTYVEALGADKSLVTLFGGVVGLTALGHPVVRSILVREHLLAIHNRLLSFDGGSSSKSTNGVVAIKPEIKSEIKSEITNNKSSGTVGGVKRKLDGPQRVKEEGDGLSREMCRGAVLKTLGCYMVTSMRLPSSDLRLTGKGRSGGDRLKSTSSLPLCDLEEALVPYYASASTQDYYCRLFI